MQSTQPNHESALHVGTSGPTAANGHGIAYKNKPQFTTALKSVTTAKTNIPPQGLRDTFTQEG